jgi:hypothetical protein
LLPILPQLAEAQFCPPLFEEMLSFRNSEPRLKGPAKPPWRWEARHALLSYFAKTILLFHLYSVLLQDCVSVNVNPLEHTATARLQSCRLNAQRANNVLQSHRPFGTRLPSCDVPTSIGVLELGEAIQQTSSSEQTMPFCLAHLSDFS